MKSPTSHLPVFGCDVLERHVPLIAVCALTFLTLSLPHSADAALHEYRMTFTPSSSPETVGYTFHVGNESTLYTAEFDLGNPPPSGGTVIYALDLEDSKDLFMALRAYDAQGLRSQFSNEILVDAVISLVPSPPAPEPDPVLEPEPLPNPNPEPTPEPVASPSPEPAPNPGPTDPTAPRSAVLFFDDFEGYVSGQDPTDWLDTGAGNDLAENPGLFGVAAAPDGGLALTTVSTETNIHSHYANEAAGTDVETTASSLEWWNYDYVGRMRFDDPSAGIGVTVLSDYPNTDSYLRLRRYQGRSSFHLAPHSQFSTDSCLGRTETEVETISNTWYHFRFRTVDENGATRVLARVWPEDDLEPSLWQIDCLWDAWPNAAGRPGVWSMGPGQKFWDDLGANEIETSGVSDPLPLDDLPPEDSPLYAEDFEGLALGSDPALWLDTAGNNAFTVDPDLFSVGEAPDGSRALVNRTRETNIHSHYLGDQASSWQDYEYSGRMRFSSDRSGMGVTTYSDYPDSNSYIRLRRYSRRPGFHIANHSDPASKCLGSTESGVTSKPGIWYEFRLRTFREAGAIRVQGKVWADTDSEPIDWQIDCVTSDTGLLAQDGGAPGIWSMGSGEKFWDDIRVERMASPAP